MRIVNVFAALAAATFLVAIALALQHRQPPGAGLHAALIIDVSGTSRAPDRCDAAGVITSLAFADSGSARFVDAWFTGTRSRSDAEPVHVATWTRARVPVSVEQRSPARQPDVEREELVARCQQEPPANQSPL